MAVPSDKDIAKRKKNLEKFKKLLNDDGSMSEKKLCQNLRSAIRQVWMRHPVKLAYLMERTYPDMNPDTRTKWLVDCEHCNRVCKLSEIEVDHIHGEHPLQRFDQLVAFADSILGVTHDDIRVVCKQCHETLTYAERYNITFEEALIEKEVIKKAKLPVTKQKEELKGFGYLESDVTNQPKRNSCWREVITNGVKKIP